MTIVPIVNPVEQVATASSSVGTPQQWSTALLDAALRQHRLLPSVNGSLWTRLVKHLPGQDESLIHTLKVSQGVLVIGDAQWVSVRPDASTGGRQALGQGLFPVHIADKTVLLSEDPWSADAILAISRAYAGAHLALARPGQIAQLAGDGTDAPETQPVFAPSDAVNSDSLAVAFVEQAIIQARQQGASDIHFETDRVGVGVKFRLDGVMAAGQRLNDPQRAEEVVSRIKVMAQLDITERRRPQDGRIHWMRQGQDSIDLRVSVMPSIHGEDVVLRLLDKAQLRQSDEQMSLDPLGFDSGVAHSIRDLASRPYGMLLVTGPTGSGKTTTVYAALSEVNDGLEKIVTIEDPVEYELAGVLQIPVNEQKGLTFASGLRSILRHDPDKILVGEIRDAETAEIAIQSSLTGHLVFTTVHANSLFDVLGRFQHFGIDPFALTSALNGIVVQRLLRKVCPQCVAWGNIDVDTQKTLAVLGLTPHGQVPQAQGCDHCRGTGYKGRFVVAEVHVLDDKTRDLILNKTSLSELKHALYGAPGARLLERAMQQVQKGHTTLEEVRRVVGFF